MFRKEIGGHNSHPVSLKVVVVGGAGFIGSHLVDALIERGHEVHVIDDLSGGKRENVNMRAMLHVVDMRDRGAVRPIVDGSSYVFHLAALPRVQRSIDMPFETNDVNVNGLLSVLIAARDAKVKRFIYSGSSSVYGDQEEMPLREDMPVNPKSPYGLQKLIGEQYAKVFSSVYGLPTVSLRYFSVYGPRFSTADGPYMLVMGRFVEQRKNNQPLTITGDGTQTRDFTHVRDIVRANILAMEAEGLDTHEVFNIGAGRPISVNDLARIIGGPVEYTPARIESKHTYADNRKAKELLGWEPTVSFEEGIRELKGLFGLFNT